jgi:NTE family protein
MEVPAAPLRELGATHVISVALPNPASIDPRSIFCVMTRSFQIYSSRTEHEWRTQSSLVIEPPVAGIAWDAFESCEKLVEAGELAAEAAMPEIRKWLLPDCKADLTSRGAPVPTAARFPIPVSPLSVTSSRS